MIPLLLLSGIFLMLDPRILLFECYLHDLVLNIQLVLVCIILTSTHLLDEFGVGLQHLASFHTMSVQFVLGVQVCSFVFIPTWQSFVHSRSLIICVSDLYVHFSLVFHVQIMPHTDQPLSHVMLSMHPPSIAVPLGVLGLERDIVGGLS